MLKELVLKNRSYRRFRQDHAIPEAVLREMVDLARLTASGANRQPLRYVLSCDPVLNDRIFHCLAWAGYLTSWRGPAEGERPSAYIVMAADPAAISGGFVDPGIAAQTILLGATERGLGGCMLGSVKREELASLLSLPAPLSVVLVIAIGEPAETVVLEPVLQGNIKYWRDPAGVHHVPKYSLDEVIITPSRQET